MAQRSKTTFQKREREKDKRQKQKDKEARRLETKGRVREPINGNEDPDIAGIKPGPQPLPEQWQLAARNDGE